jgi:hypothetical protein
MCSAIKRRERSSWQGNEMIRQTRANERREERRRRAQRRASKTIRQKHGGRLEKNVGNNTVEI